ncbi:phage major capsid protein [Gluconobacter cerinus]|uniref:phage major capsid protein n=1 Tax=Gluconobacter cerinus TaxID=38307 RepID=UPI001B8AAF15|nr:phage major capsid protein [Gluconobacter cerinus]MBS1035386.1 phage major capsid protein [Gluconobacter cerinus]
MSYNRETRNASARPVVTGLQTRSASGEGGSSPAELRGIIENINRTFGEFRSQNDQRLQQLEQRGSSDVVTEDAVNRINQELTRLSNELREVETRSNRPGGSGTGNQDSPERVEHRSAWDAWARRGAGEHELRSIERRANTTLVPEDGGFLVPDTVDRNILDILGDQSTVRSLFTSITVSADSYKRLVGLHGTGAGWVGETDARPATNGPQFGEAEASFGELYANPQISQRLLDDSALDLESYIGNEIALAFADTEGPAYLFGDGVKKPKGLFSQATSAQTDKERPYGTFQALDSAAANGLGANSAATDRLIDVIYSTRSVFRQNARWLMNGLTVSAVRKLKDGQGNYLWQPSAQAGEPASLLNYPVSDMEEMPDVAAGNIAIAFGSFQRAYQIVDRMGIRTLRDPYTNKPYVGFYATKRTGGVVLDTRAVKFLKIAST